MDVSRTMRSYKENLVALSDRLGPFFKFLILLANNALVPPLHQGGHFVRQ